MCILSIAFHLLFHIACRNKLKMDNKARHKAYTLQYLEKNSRSSLYFGVEEDCKKWWRFE